MHGTAPALGRVVTICQETRRSLTGQIFV